MARKRARARKKLTAWEWFGQAEQFELAAMWLLDLPVAVREQMPAALVAIRAFGVEAYFKCLLTLGDKDIPREHGLDILFAKMRQRDQRNLSKLWRIECGKRIKALKN